jgi:hypothetical protein
MRVASLLEGNAARLACAPVALANTEQPIGKHFVRRALVREVHGPPAAGCDGLVHVI